MSLNSDQSDRNHQLYRLHEVFTYRRNLGALKRIEEEFKLCKFEPDLNPRKEVVQSRYLEPKASPLKSEADRYNCNMTIDEEE